MKLTGIVTRVLTGEYKGGRNPGEKWQKLTLEGLTLFIPTELQNGYARGDRLVVEVSHQGDTKTEVSGGRAIYEPKFSVLAVNRVVVSDA